jgi:hypothetical protein
MAIPHGPKMKESLLYPNYGEATMRTAGPERQRHLEQVMANDGHLAELSREARAKMAEPSRG